MRQVVALYKGRPFSVVRDIIKDPVLIVPQRSVIFSLFVPPSFHYSVSVSVSHMMCLKNNDEECKSREQKGRTPDSVMRAGNRCAALFLTEKFKMPETALNPELCENCPVIFRIPVA